MPESKRRKPKQRPQSLGAAEAAKAKEPSPTWYVALMAGLMVVGVVLVLLRFILQWDQIILVAGLAAIAAGFLMTTNYR
jgi:hypothetical protein